MPDLTTPPACREAERDTAARKRLSRSRHDDADRRGGCRRPARARGHVTEHARPPRPAAGGSPLPISCFGAAFTRGRRESCTRAVVDLGSGGTETARPPLEVTRPGSISGFSRGPRRHRVTGGLGLAVIFQVGTLGMRVAKMVSPALRNTRPLVATMIPAPLSFFIAHHQRSGGGRARWRTDALDRPPAGSEIHLQALS